MSPAEKTARRVLGMIALVVFYGAMVFAIVNWLPFGKGGDWALAAFMVGGSVWSGWIGYRRGRHRAEP
jgi:hypothetical protein